MLSLTDSQGNVVHKQDFLYPLKCVSTLACETSKLVECGPMPSVMAALWNTGGAICSTPHSLADAHY